MNKHLEDDDRLRYERISIAEFAKAIARDLGLTGAAFGLHVTSIENKILKLAGIDGITFYEPDTGIAYDGNELIALSEDWLISHRTGKVILERFFPELHSVPNLPVCAAAMSVNGDGELATPANPVDTVGKDVSNSKKHKLKNKRHALDAVIERAEKEAVDPNDPHSVWAALVKIASDNNRPAPLIGNVEGEGIKYSTDKEQEDGNFVGIYKKASLLMRYHRMAQNNKSK